MDDLQLISCKNCQVRLPSTFYFCPICGQEQNVIVNLAHIGRMFISGFSFDSGFLYNLNRLILSGGTAANEYCEGKSKPYQNPILFFFATLGVFLVQSLTTGLISGEFPVFPESGEVQYLSVETNTPSEWRVRFNYLFATLIIIPIFSIIAHAVGEAQKNYTEALISSFLFIGATTLFYSVILLISRFVFSAIVENLGYYNPSTLEGICAFILLSVYTPFYFYKFYAHLSHPLVRGITVAVAYFGLIGGLIYLGNN